ncbi:hypothetical protein Aba10324_17560 [Acinetobacter baumannii]|uniref:hypothetical protein n=1 Tax=Acinetobacter baumannii TaxID=470 RepID=UPI000E57BFBF|nr:hypothetical protein [Acinetobacter baumannii]AXX46591.1 hypothetical protein Aba10324_17560 [Acinetobacter baumannii]
MDKAMTFNEWLGTQGNMVLLHANCCRIAFEGGQQSMQAKVEELEKQLREYIFVAETIDEMYVKEVKSSEELQKRVGQQGLIIAKAMSIASDLQKSWSMFEIGKKLEQALKGEG